MLRHRGGLGFAHREEVAEGAVILQPQIAVAAEAAFLLFLMVQPGVLVIELISQPIEQWIDAIVHQPPLTQAERRCVDQLVAHGIRQVRQLGLRLQELIQPCWPLLHPALELGRQLWQSLQAVGDRHQIASTGVAGSGPARKPLEIPHRSKQPTQAQAQLALLHQGRHHRLALLNGIQIHQGRFNPAPQAATAHGGEASVDGPEHRPLQLAVPLGGRELEVAAGLGIQHQGITAEHDRGGVQRNGAGLLQRLGVAQVGNQSPEGAKSQGDLRKSEAVEARQPVVAQQRRFGVRAAEGSAGHPGEMQSVRAPGRA